MGRWLSSESNYFVCFGQAFGSNNGFVQVSLGSGIVISMAAIILRKEIPERAFSPLALVSQIAIVAWLVASAYTNSVTPYRSAPMLLNDTRIDIRGSSLYIDSNLALELESLRKCAALEGWERGTGLLDYTRWSPGIAFMLDARVPATLVPIIGGYEGSRAFAIETVRAELRSGRADAFLENAWILLPRAETSGGAELLGIAEEAIGEFGKTFLDYQSVCVTKDV